MSNRSSGTQELKGGLMVAYPRFPGSPSRLLSWHGLARPGRLGMGRWSMVGGRWSIGFAIKYALYHSAYLYLPQPVTPTRASAPTCYLPFPAGRPVSSSGWRADQPEGATHTHTHTHTHAHKRTHLNTHGGRDAQRRLGDSGVDGGKWVPRAGAG